MSKTIHRLIGQFRNHVLDFTTRPLSLEDLHIACGQHGFEIVEERLPGSIHGFAFRSKDI